MYNRNIYLFVYVIMNEKWYVYVYIQNSKSIQYTGTCIIGIYIYL